MPRTGREMAFSSWEMGVHEDLGTKKRCAVNRW